MNTKPQTPSQVTGHEPTCQCGNCCDAAAAIVAAWWATPVQAKD